MAILSQGILGPVTCRTGSVATSAQDKILFFINIRINERFGRLKY